MATTACEAALRDGPRTVAAVIPLYDGARTIEAAVRSVFAQSRPVDRCLVVDDGSRDDGPARVATLALDHPITLLSKPNGGQSSARNLGVAESGASHVAFLDQDDVWYPRHVEALLGAFAAAPRPLGWAYSNLDRGDEAGAVTVPRLLDRRRQPNPKPDWLACIRTEMFVLPSASLVSKAAFDSVGGFDERLVGFEDDDLFVRMMAAGYPHAYVDEALSLWRTSPGSSSHSPAMARSRALYARILFDRYGERIVPGGGLAREVIARRFARGFLGDYARATLRGDRDGAGRSLDTIRDDLIPHLSPSAARVWGAGVAVLRAGAIGALAARAWQVVRALKPPA